MEVKTCLAAFCLRQNYGVFLRKLLKSLQAAFYQSFPKKPPEFPLCEAKFCPETKIRPFNLKVKKHKSVLREIDLYEYKIIS